MIPLSVVHRTLSRCIDTVADIPFDREYAYDMATIAWLAVCALQRYMQTCRVNASQAANAERALHNVEREMRWMRLYGHTAEDINISTCVANALSNARRAATLLQEHEYQNNWQETSTSPRFGGARMTD